MKNYYFILIIVLSKEKNMPMEGIDANRIKMNGILQNVKLIIAICDFIIINMSKDT